MELVTVCGIVIKETPYSETSKIINILTKEYGTIGVIAKGARNIKSKLRSVTTKLTFGYFQIYYKSNGLSILVSVDIIDNLKNIKTDITKVSYACYLLELVTQVMKHEYNENIFNLLISSLIKINENFDPEIITNIIELKMLEYLGVKPIIDECAICGSKTNIITISGDRGGYICKNCRQDEYIVSDKTIKLIRMFYYVDISKISKLKISDKVKYELDIFINSYYDRYTGIYLKSKKFINDIKKLKIS